jgi:tetratricopeptide (TPR) repeat protein/predicted Ser/Thr protein kinase
MGERAPSDTVSVSSAGSDLPSPSRSRDVHQEDADRAALSDAPPAIAVGSCLGRYTVISPIGGGGMGEVFAADDPELGRTVALKVIRPDRLLRSPSARLRLMREAQALAKLHHPNVVTVYDVGAEGEQVFIAMELVEGESLGSWLRKGRRSWREVLTRFLAAGRGLAVAHDAGIVHRDFKPDNVIVGNDRVVVIDFGLARRGEDDSGDSEPARAALDANLTQTGERFGTLPYMAPEQLAGTRAVAQSDQFAFCVSLWEGLHGERPTTATARRLNADVPRWINRSLQRGLAAEPADRWPSMQALLTELGRDRRATLRRALVAGATIGLAGIASYGLLRPTSLDPCRSGPTVIAKSWGPAQEEGVRAAFLATKAPTASDVFQRTKAALDDYTERWVSMYADACRATRVEGRQSDSMMDLRMECLDRRRAVLESLIAVWKSGVDADTLEHAQDAVSNLQSLAECADTRVLSERLAPPADASVAAKVKNARRRSDEIQAQVAAHHLADARKAAEQLRIEAEAIGWPLLAAESEFLEGDVLAALEDPSAEGPLLQATRNATAARDDRLAARALVRLIDVLGKVKQNAAQALLFAEVAEGEVARLGDEELGAKLRYARANALLTSGKIDEAKTTMQEALDLAVRAFGDKAPETLLIRTSLVEVARQKGKYDEACQLGEAVVASTVERVGPDHPQVVQALTVLAASAMDGDDKLRPVGYLRRALEISEKTAGPDSAATATVVRLLGRAVYRTGALDEAEALLKRALEIREKVSPPDDPNIGHIASNLADVYSDSGRFEEALALQHRTVEIWLKAYGPRHPKFGTALHKLGGIYLDKGDAETALGYYRQALDLRMAVLGADHEMTLFTMALVGQALAQLRRCSEARPLLERAAEALKTQVGEGHSDFIRTQGPLGECDLAEHHPAQAVARLEHAMEIEAGPKHDASTRGDHRFVLARALWEVGRRREAIQAARLSVDEVATNAGSAWSVARIKDWLAKHS